MSNTISKAGLSEIVLQVETVDTANRPIKPDVVRWWYSDKPEKKSTLTCMQVDCSRVLISGGLSSPVTIYALASQIKENDKNCWDWYEAEFEVQELQEMIKLTLIYKRTVCK